MEIRGSGGVGGSWLRDGGRSGEGTAACIRHQKKRRRRRWPMLRDEG